MSTSMNNTRISARANASINRRKTQIRREKRILTIAVIIIISIIAILCSSIRAMASSNEDSMNYTKVYKSITVEPGDTLWAIADEYNICSNQTKEQYINEIKKLNHLGDGSVHAGQNLVIAYYTNGQ